MTDGLGLGMEADASAKIVLALGSVREEIRRSRAENAEYARQRQLSRLKNYIPLSADVILNGSGQGVVDLGTPALGRQWTVRQIMAAVLGGELSANAAANIGWYIGTNVPTVSGQSLQVTTQWRASFTGVPAVNTYTSDILQLRFGDHLFAIVNGPVGQAGASMVFNAVVLDEPMKVGIPASVQ